MHTVYVIYKDGKPLEGHTRGLKRNAFDKKGSAKSNVTAMINDHLRYTMDIDEFYDREKWKEEEEKERKRYEVVEYVRR